MTKNQIEYLKAREEQRANRAQEEIKSREAAIKEREAGIKSQEAGIKERAQQLEEALFDYNRLGSGSLSAISRLIQAYGKDTGIDSAIKKEARSTNTSIISGGEKIKSKLQSKPVKGEVIRNILAPAAGLPGILANKVVEAIQRAKQKKKEREENENAKQENK